MMGAMTALPPRMRESLGDIARRLSRTDAPTATDGEVARIPVEHYTSREVRDAEVERLFRPLPLIVGHASELRRGEVLAHDEYGVPMLLARDGERRFRAFLNVCRHRGMRLVDGVEAKPVASVVCPYHGWTYRLDGALRHRLHAESFDDCSADAVNLVALPAEERHGLLWVVPTPGATIDVAAFLGELDGELPFCGIDGLRLFRTVRAEYPANWKLIVDALTGAARLGPHVQSLVARRAAEAWLAEGGAIPSDFASLCDLATPSHVVFPNVVTIFHPDYLSLITLYPVDAETLSWTHRMLVPADRTTPDWTPHWEKTFALIEQGVFEKEDIACAVAIQRGLKSGANRHLTAGRAEQGVGWFHAEVERALARDAAGSRQLSRA